MIDFKNLKTREEGSILIESIVAINVTLVGLLGVLSLLSNSLALNRDVGEKFIATYLAAEGIEIVRNLTDANFVQGNSWNAGINDGEHAVSYDSESLLPSSENYLSFKDGLYGYDAAGAPTIFKRSVGIENVSAQEITVVSTVFWSTKRGVQEVKLEDHFFNWRKPL
ncbi:MAG: hypothetical protein AAB935_00665 [Patescibacteria group bacterium]